MAGGNVRVRRVYDEPEADDGTRVLVDRIWPRGMTKARAALGEWCKDVAPSTELRKWYGHDPDRFEEFTRRYRLELTDPGRAGDAAHRDEGTCDQRGFGARLGAGELSPRRRRSLMGPGRRRQHVTHGLDQQCHLVGDEVGVAR